MEFQLLGPLDVGGKGRPVILGGSRERTVLAMLLLEAGHAVSLERLIDAVWGEEPPATARGQIQICISSLRRRMLAACGEDPIETRRPGYLLHAGDGSMDLHRFEQRVGEGRAALAAGRPAEAAAILRSALDLWRGAALADVDSALVQQSAGALNERRLAVLGEAVHCGLLAGEHHRLIGQLAELIAEYPLHEHFRALLMSAYYRSGRQAEALDVYRQVRTVLREELGVEPGAELRRLHAEMLNGTLVLAGETAEPEPAARERAAEETDGEAADHPLPAVPARRAPNLLPADIPDFTGRATMVDLIMQGFAAPEPGQGERAVRICMITGQGGAGKTTLAIHAAHLLSPRFPDGRLFAHLRDADRPIHPTALLERFLRALGVVGLAVPKTLEERAELFRDLVSERRLLMVLDDAMSEEQVKWLLPGTADCAVIVTSRRRLTGLPSATRLEVGALGEAGAVELLGRSIGAERIAGEAESVSELNRLCGHLPLAIRICAARLAARPHWSVADLVDRLVDEARRLDELNHGELQVRASIALTYDSLPDDARRLFRRLAMLKAPSFAGWVGAPLLNVDVLRAQEALEVLAEAYLIDAKPGPGGQIRYGFHEITRPFAQERLVEESAADRTAALARWLGALLTLTGEAHRREYSGGYLERRSLAPRWPLPARLLERLLKDPLAWHESERGSIAAAVRQAAAAGMAQHCWDLALSSVTLFEAYSYFDDWRDTNTVALRAAVQAGDREGEAAMCYSLGSLHMFEHAREPALQYLERAHALYQDLADDHGRALVLRNWAYLNRLTGDVRSAQARWQEALGIFRRTGDRIAEAHVLHNLAQAHMDHGEITPALSLLEQAAAICLQVGNRRVGAQVQHRFGELYLREGRLEEARAAYTQVLESVRASGDRVGECYGMLGLATARLRQGDGYGARAMLIEARDLAVQAAARMVESRITLALAEVSLAEDLAAAPVYAEQALEGFELVGSALDRARAMVMRGRVQAAYGRRHEAQSDWEHAAVMLAEIQSDGSSPELAEEVCLLLGDDPDPGPACGPR